MSIKKLSLLNDDLIIIDDFLPVDLFLKLSRKKYNPKSNSYKSWDPKLYSDQITKKKNFNKIDFQTLFDFEEMESDGEMKPSKLFVEYLECLRKCRYLSLPRENKRYIGAYYEYKTGSGINWHNDGVFSYNITLHLNLKWHDDWGGELLVMGEDGERYFVETTPNRLVVLKGGGNLHKVCPVLGDHTRKTIQSRIISF